MLKILKCEQKYYLQIDEQYYGEYTDRTIDDAVAQYVDDRVLPSEPMTTASLPDATVLAISDDDGHTMSIYDGLDEDTKKITKHILHYYVLCPRCRRRHIYRTDRSLCSTCQAEVPTLRGRIFDLHYSPDDYGTLMAQYDGAELYIGVRRQRCEKLGIPYIPAFHGFFRANSGKFVPIIKGIMIRKCDCSRLDESLKADEERLAKRRAQYRERKKRKKQELEELAASLGLLPNSRTFRAYLDGELDTDEARRIGAITRWRHERTNYEQLLREGCDCDTARELMTEI